MVKLLSAAVVLALTSPAIAAPSGAAFLNIDPSARSYALGSADAVASNGPEAMGRNPANIGLMLHKYEAFTSYETLLDGSQYGHMAFGLSAENLPADIDGLGVSLTRLSASGFKGADVDGNYTGSSFSASDMAVTFGASSRLSPTLRLGADIKGVRSQIASYTSNWALAADLGLTATFERNERPLSLALTVDNIGQGLKFRSQTDPLPTALKAAAAVPLGGSAMGLAQVSQLVFDHQSKVGLGMEYAMGVAAMRLGYSATMGGSKNLALADQKGASKVLGGLTAGLGIRWGNLGVDYAISQQAVDYGTTQRISLRLSWGGEGRSRHEEKASGKTADSRADWLLNSARGY